MAYTVSFVEANTRRLAEDRFRHSPCRSKYPKACSELDLHPRAADVPAGPCQYTQLAYVFRGQKSSLTWMSHSTETSSNAFQSKRDLKEEILFPQASRLIRVSVGNWTSGSRSF